ncbi:MAG TPA: lysylphosphatidylglycerol synthase domain-containing protein [Acetobacteraceae bacterium]|nr:lysylphosphatidylglycerol synthase domain-containing protein [Acetobacteraceae bacterium]
MSFSRAGLLLIVCGGAVAGMLIGRIGIGDVAEEVLRAGWALPACIAIHLTTLFLSAMAWRRLDGGGAPTLGVWFAIRWIRESVNGLLPVAQVGGPLVGVRLLAQRGVGAAAGTAATTLDITLESLTQALFTISGLLAVVAAGGNRALLPWLGGGVGLMAVGAVGFLLAQRAGLMRAIEWLTARMSRLVPALSPDVLQGLHAELMRRQRDPAAMTTAAALHLLAWVTGVAETWVVLRAMGYGIHPLAALAVESLGMAARSAGFAVPGSLGIQEGGFVLAGSLLGLPPDAAAALSMVKRAREVLVGVPGLIAWPWAEGRRALRRAAVQGARP